MIFNYVKTSLETFFFTLCVKSKFLLHGFYIIESFPQARTKSQMVRWHLDKQSLYINVVIIML